MEFVRASDVNPFFPFLYKVECGEERKKEPVQKGSRGWHAIPMMMGIQIDTVYPRTDPYKIAAAASSSITHQEKEKKKEKKKYTFRFWRH